MNYYNESATEYENPVEWALDVERTDDTLLTNCGEVNIPLYIVAPSGVLNVQELSNYDDSISKLKESYLTTYPDASDEEVDEMTLLKRQLKQKEYELEMALLEVRMLKKLDEIERRRYTEKANMKKNMKQSKKLAKKK